MIIVIIIYPKPTKRIFVMPPPERVSNKPN
jgi:hypothetical protein|nr:MAG TPA: hypothetical protein [Caudoviricetes sp.]